MEPLVQKAGLKSQHNHTMLVSNFVNSNPKFEKSGKTWMHKMIHIDKNLNIRYKIMW
jgi:hypothetical protein